MNQDELFWSSSDNEDDDMKDEPASVNEEGNEYLGDDHDMAESSHATTFINGEKGNIIEFITSRVCSFAPETKCISFSFINE